MNLTAQFVVAEVYYSEKSDVSYLRVVPDTGGIMSVVVAGRVMNVEPGVVVAYNGPVKVYGKNGNLSLTPGLMKILRNGGEDGKS